ncbi:hypothetical protein ABZ851_30365 [Streptomyces sp. NPDC047049]|uniref:hypothetical protein n=1 Tax=Streptomyces sp. NPDC047049 TaxID=3156688 RepID=UPI0033C5C0A1
MPYIYLHLSRGDRVERPTGNARATHGTVIHVTWESATGARYFIQWDGSALARRYKTEQLQEQRIRRVSEPAEMGEYRRKHR